MALAGNWIRQNDWSGRLYYYYDFSFFFLLLLSLCWANNTMKAGYLDGACSSP